MKNRIFAAMVCAIALASSLTACASRQTMGTAGGAALGGVIGNEVGHGSTAGTIGGAAVGGVIGHEIAK